MIVSMSTRQFAALDAAHNLGSVWDVSYDRHSGNLTMVYRVAEDIFRDVIAGDGSTVMTGVIEPESLLSTGEEYTQ